MMVIPGVLKTNDVVSRKVPLAIAAPNAETTGITDPIVRAAAVVNSIVLVVMFDYILTRILLH